MPASLHDSSTALTLEYYQNNAQQFINSTVDVEFSAMQKRFTSLLPEGAHILDFGCGSGRDAKYFKDLGYQVTATDGSNELCAIASRYAGIPVRNELFQDLTDTNEYDGIWACSSILHLPKEELADVFQKMSDALKPSGIIYTSFKYGEFEGIRNGRYFTDFTEADFADFIKLIPSLKIEESWISGDVRPGRENEKWLNLIIRKQ